MTLNNTLNGLFGAGQWSWYNVLDCLMTTTCSNRQIPDTGTDGNMNNELFDATIAHAEELYSYVALYNESQWSKLALGNVAWHVRTNLELAIENAQTAKKFVLFSGHDTTIMPFLAATLKANWDRRWARYAAMISIELFSSSTVGEDDLFRFVYNGQVLQVPGCPPVNTGESLCNYKMLIEALGYGKEQEPCSINSAPDVKPTPLPIISDGNALTPHTSLSTGGWVSLVVLSALFGAAIGAFVSSFLTKRHHLLTDTSLLGENLIIDGLAKSHHPLNLNSST